MIEYCSCAPAEYCDTPALTRPAVRFDPPGGNEGSARGGSTGEEE